MRAALMMAKGILEVGEIPDPRPLAGEALVEVDRAGICGSDLVTLADGRPKELPRVLGHEFAGTLREIEGNTGYPFKPGDRVVAEPISGCGICRSCRNGQYNVCDDRVILGVETDGVFAQYVRVPLENLLTIPGEMSFEEAALVQPVAVAVHAFRRTAFQGGSAAAVLGAGPIGALLAMLARASGGTTVVVTEPNPFRRELMENLGFPAIDPVEEDPVAAALSHLSEGDEGFDVVFDAAGSTDSVRQATEMTRVGGQVMMVATYHGNPDIGITRARKREMNYLTTRAHVFDDFRASLNLISSRQLDVRPLITNEIGLGEVPGAFETLTSGGPMMKVLCQP
ncbi:MAG: alcohol dehydrogenase catalytic domain-containing protein [Nitrospinota bacterium]|jgi:2-desacetyl-2-hydroxyethyl bacteriochlorophyllide A dehydrogenase|nr:alcohol dehydrogenase catalytic domain-containing protein [Nitrospinota bacterium]MDP7166802.1 alcohol dehydrogenase catalytic domain-containing protein [Nitrospinota bacterium]MDP7370817.1 alcohol dehydrogenase catalytic domain-containing protein [Nitrospinota bacterium]MDP7503455.1 alcohol dehydrogenase catalytic domain-containing protein [Nitrospinota bacterium]MDP7665034.1 alcohol dehydrogenase catalytic domain-containing protein [Nitrospinota bacterium]